MEDTISPEFQERIRLACQRKAKLWGFDSWDEYISKEYLLSPQYRGYSINMRIGGVNIKITNNLA